MEKIILLLIITFTSLCAKASQSMCTGNVTKELEACARVNFEYSDKNLNLAYDDLARKLSAADKGILVRTEKNGSRTEALLAKASLMPYPPARKRGLINGRVWIR